jgi:hypothetical protein
MKKEYLGYVLTVLLVLFSGVMTFGSLKADIKNCEKRIDKIDDMARDIKKISEDVGYLKGKIENLK